jgi:3-oxoacyl-[acyl-carrier-protein] synthase-1
MRLSAESDLRVGVVAVGAFTPVGKTAPATAAAVRAGLAGFSDYPMMVDKAGDSFVVATVPNLAIDIDATERLAQLAFPAANEVLSILNKCPSQPYSISMIVGFPSERPGLGAKVRLGVVERLERMIRYGYRFSEIQIIPSGHSAGLMAIETACQMIRHGKTEFCLVGGVDSYIEPETLKWVEDCGQLHSSYNAWGFVPGEAAGFCLLCSSAVAERYRLEVQGWFISLATAREENRIKTETICLGQGLSQAVGAVLKTLTPNEKINYTICDQNGEPYRADEFGFMLARNSERFTNGSDFLAPADCWGDVGAASGPLFVTLAVSAAQKGYAKGPHTLMWTSSEGGERSAAIFSAKVQERRS